MIFSEYILSSDLTNGFDPEESVIKEGWINSYRSGKFGERPWIYLQVFYEIEEDGEVKEEKLFLKNSEFEAVNAYFPDLDDLRMRFVDCAFRGKTLVGIALDLDD